MLPSIRAQDRLPPRNSPLSREEASVSTQPVETLGIG